MAADIGVDRLCWELTDHPEDMFSRRFAPGSAALAAIKHEIWDDNNLGNAIPGATPRARIEVRGPLPGLPLVARAGRPVTMRTKVRNLSSRALPRAGQLTAAVWSASARSSARRDGAVVNRDFERAWLPADAVAGRRASTCAMTLTAPDETGPLRFEVRSGQRGDRLVRGVRLGDDDEGAGRILRSYQTISSQLVSAKRLEQARLRRRLSNKLECSLDR